MKRSEINSLISSAKDFFWEQNFKLPPWAFWSLSDWKSNYNSANDPGEIINNMLGWDLTDFGSGDFISRGLLLFTIRNGHPHHDAKTYAEKVMIVEENQETPMHYHWNKTEDIINRGGGNLIIELFNPDEKDRLSDTLVEVSIDGIKHVVEPGGKVRLTPGESICLPRKLYHRFYGESGKGRVLVGEASSVNDDNTDNRFLESIGRFPDISEDEEPLHLLVSDYEKFISEA